MIWRVVWEQLLRGVNLLPCESKRQYLPTLQVSWYCLLVYGGYDGYSPPVIEFKHALIHEFHSACIIQRCMRQWPGIGPVMGQRVSARKSRHDVPMFLWCWARVKDAVSTSQQLWANMPCLLWGCYYVWLAWWSPCVVKDWPANSRRWRSVGLMLANVADGGRKLNRHLINVSFFVDGKH